MDPLTGTAASGQVCSPEDSVIIEWRFILFYLARVVNGSLKGLLGSYLSLKVHLRSSLIGLFLDASSVPLWPLSAGGRLISLNNISLEGVTFSEAAEVIQNSPEEVQLIISQPKGTLFASTLVRWLQIWWLNWSTRSVLRQQTCLSSFWELLCLRMTWVSVTVSLSPPQPNKSTLFFDKKLRVTGYINGRQTIGRWKVGWVHFGHDGAQDVQQASHSTKSPRCTGTSLLRWCRNQPHTAESAQECL